MITFTDYENAASYKEDMEQMTGKTYSVVTTSRGGMLLYMVIPHTR